MILKTLTALALLTLPALAQKSITLYTNREQGLIKPLLDEFTSKSGIKVEALYLNAGLLERLQLEGAQSKADVVIVTDVTIAELARERKLTSPLSPALLNTVGPQFKDEGGEWLGLSSRARVVYTSKERVKEQQITYSDLAHPKWKGKICIRQGQHPYNLGLIANAIALWGEAKTESWLLGVKANLARKPSGGDRDVARDIVSGLCDIGIGNLYYVGLMSQDEKQKEWVKTLNVLYPTFEGGGTHVNMSASFIPNSAPNKQEAASLLSFMLSEQAQAFFAQKNFETPVMKTIAPAVIFSDYGTMKPDPTSFKTMSQLREQASKLVEKTGFDQ